jgi:hypothetical protein
MSKRSQSRYSGELGRRTLPTAARELVTEEQRRVIDQKFNLLFDYFGILRPDGASLEVQLHSWMGLALILAFRHVPGFQSKKRPGAPKGPRKWTLERKARLYADVTLEVGRGKSETEACHHLVKREPWKHFYPKPNSLWRRFKEFEKEPKICALMERARRHTRPTKEQELLLLMQNTLDDFPA